MRYLALGDSMSIDKYTGVEGGGTVSQFARLIGADEVQDLTHDGFTTDAVIESLAKISIQPDIITLTLGGNDLLQRPSWNVDRYSLKDPDTAETLKKLHYVYSRLYTFHCKVIVNTIYNPTDGDEALLQQLGMSEPFRAAYNEVNKAIRWMARKYGFLLSDLQELFNGHGINSADTWVTMEIEPNHKGATAIAERWYELFVKPENDMVMRDINDRWSFSLRINDFQCEYEENMDKQDQWLIMSFRVASPDSSWHWIDPSLMFDDVKALAAWFSDIADDKEVNRDISFLEPEISFKLVDRCDEAVTLRVYLYHNEAPFGRRWKQEFRGAWTKSKHLEYRVQVVYKDFTVARQDLSKASKSLLDNLRQLPNREGLSVDSV